MPKGEIIKCAKRTFELIDMSDLDSVQMSYFVDGVAIVEREDENEMPVYGLMSTNGDFVIPSKCSHIDLLEEGLFSVVFLDEPDSCYLYNSKGKRVVETPFKFLGPTGCGRIPFIPKGDVRYGYLNYNGEVVIEPQYDDADSFSNNMALVLYYIDDIHCFGYIDTAGRLLFNNARFAYASILIDGFAYGVPYDEQFQPYPVQVIIDSNSGEFIIPIEDDLYWIDENMGKGFFAIKHSVDDKEEKFFVFDAKSDRCITVNESWDNVDRVYVINDDVVGFSTCSDKVVKLCDVKNNLISRSHYSEVRDFYDGFFKAVSADVSKISLVNTDLVEIVHDAMDIEEPSEGVVCVKNSDTDYYFASVNGGRITAKHFRYAAPYNRGLSVVASVNDHMQLVDRCSRVVMPITFTSLQYYGDDTYLAIRNGKRYILRELLN